MQLVRVRSGLTTGVGRALRRALAVPDAVAPVQARALVQLRVRVGAGRHDAPLRGPRGVEQQQHREEEEEDEEREKTRHPGILLLYSRREVVYSL